MKSIVLLFVSLFLCGPLLAQKVPPLPAEGATLADFIPKGWHLLDSAMGEINRDGRKDAVLALEANRVSLHRYGPSAIDTFSAKARVLLVLLSNAKGKLAVHYASDKFIPYRLGTWEPLNGASIPRPGILTLSFAHQYPRDSEYGEHVDYTFRFEDGALVLIGADYEANVGRSWEYESYSYNFLTGKRSKVVGDEENNTSGKPTWRSFKKRRLLLATMKGPFTTEMADDQIAL
ncbi:hypothetical protein [Flaviaesturariibacter aridisoli]|uniref:VCBS repeat-containing protein n=1 Tax=Flaviaesturariibacter aridisoli TaxID=2545761 RepID=A0A4R4DX61_9BACT|nr:hypothetical protein [Flaviaesturariibacter aridisoli]TCZ67474.1 hypothetical protein E0486_15455 [Flaviaesturariibacter aridisoli]